MPKALKSAIILRMKKILAPIFVFFAISCSSSVQQEAREAWIDVCQEAAKAAAVAKADEMCPRDAGPWDECPHARKIEDGLAAALVACEAP